VLFKKVSPAVVTISARGEGGGDQEERSGTGFFIDEEGTIATNEHVIHGAKAVGIKLIGEGYPGGHRWLAEVELLEANPDIDLALLRVHPQDDIEPLLLGDSESITPGDDVVCIGNPLGLEHTLSDGIVSARRMHEGKRWVQMTAPISPGNSGGPVLTLDGRVVGIATASVNRLLGTAQNLNLAVPVNELKAMIRDDYPSRRRFETGPDGPSTW
jgi:S1-C subfamily serine protease